MEYSEAKAISRPIVSNGNVISIIPARGGSKGLPKKNLRLIDNKPLINYTIEASLSCPLIARTIVTTDCSDIKEVSLNYGAEVIDRPKELATDIAKTQDVVMHVLNTLRNNGDVPQYFVLLQPTSPLRTANHISECIKLFLSSNANSVLSVTESEHHPYKMFLSNEKNAIVPLFDKKSLHEPRQLLPNIYRQNGAIYMMSSSTFLKHQTFFVEPALPYIMQNLNSIDIDSEIDLQIAELLIRKSME